MLKRAILFKSQLGRLFVEASDNPDNRFFTTSYWDYEPKIENSNWGKQQFASVDNRDNVIGWLEADILPRQHIVRNISIIRFLKDGYCDLTFSRDFFDLFAKLFIFYEYRKVDYDVVVGSPNEKWYNIYTEKYGGKIVGIKKEHYCLENGKMLDLKLYEMDRKHYMFNFEKRHPIKFKQYVNKMELKYESN